MPAGGYLVEVLRYLDITKSYVIVRSQRGFMPPFPYITSLQNVFGYFQLRVTSISGTNDLETVFLNSTVRLGIHAGKWHNG